MTQVEEALNQAKFYTDLAEIREMLMRWLLAPRQCDDLEELLAGFHELLTPLGDATHQTLRDNAEPVTEQRVREIVLADLQKYARVARTMSARLLRIAEYHECAFDKLDAQSGKSDTCFNQSDVQIQSCK